MNLLNYANFMPTLCQLFQPGNKLTAKIFFDIAFTKKFTKRISCAPETQSVSQDIERWGTGIQRMIQTCLKQGLPEPKFEEYQGFRVIFRKPFSKDELAKLGLNERQLKAVEYVERKGSITNKEYQKLDNTIKRTATRDLADLVQKGIFRSIGKGKRELKYILIIGENVPKMSQKGDDDAME